MLSILIKLVISIPHETLITILLYKEMEGLVGVLQKRMLSWYNCVLTFSVTSFNNIKIILRRCLDYFRPFLW